jgi:hypothetical protein
VFIRDRESNIPEQVLVHPSSVNAKQSKFDSPYMVFHELVRTTKVWTTYGLFTLTKSVKPLSDLTTLSADSFCLIERNDLARKVAKSLVV